MGPPGANSSLRQKPKKKKKKKNKKQKKIKKFLILNSVLVSNLPHTAFISHYSEP